MIDRARGRIEVLQSPGEGGASDEGRRPSPERRAAGRSKDRITSSEPREGICNGVMIARSTGLSTVERINTRASKTVIQVSPAARSDEVLTAVNGVLVEKPNNPSSKEFSQVGIMWALLPVPEKQEV